MKILVILLIASLIFVFVYLSYGKNTKKAAIYASLSAFLAFVGTYIVDLFDITKYPPHTDGSISVSTEITIPEKTIDENTEVTTPEETPDEDTGVTTPEETSDEDTETTTPEETSNGDMESTTTESTPINHLELNIDKIADANMKIQSIESNVIENIDAQIDVFNGYLNVEKQVDTYSFTPNVTGRYRFEICGLTDGTNHKVNLVIKNSGGGVVGSTTYGITNDGGLTIDDMQAGETFQVQVKQFVGLDSYTLRVGNQKEKLDVTGYTTVKDSIEFKNQRNVYLFTPPITGKYRFEISGLAKGSNHRVNLSIYNSGGGEEKSTTYGVVNNDGITFEDMQAGQTYEVQICQYEGYDLYNLNIGYQKESVDISGYNIISDSIQYRNQKNIYFFTPTVTGRYRFEISNLTKGSNNKVNLYIYNSRGGEEAYTRYGIINGDGITHKDMQAGETYQIQVRQHEGYDIYNLNVGLQKETVDISEYSSVLDSIQYTDQQNLYTFTPSSSGKYKFEIQNLTSGSNNDVNVFVFNSRGGEEGATKYGIMNNNGLTIKDMQAGETYTIKVRYYSGYDSYKLIKTKVSK